MPPVVLAPTPPILDDAWAELAGMARERGASLSSLLDKFGITQLHPFQTLSIPTTMKGRELLVNQPTGSGK